MNWSPIRETTSPASLILACGICRRGREGEESPVPCAIREVEEEFAISLDPRSIRWLRQYPSPTKSGKDRHFLVAEATSEQIAAVSFGSEGECWKMMPIKDFLHHPRAVPDLKRRLTEYLLERR